MKKLAKIKKEIIDNQLIYLLLSIILLLSAFFRLFRLHQLLGFWYDQGRDALVIWDLIHYKRFFLIGPVTGIEGIFLGPFYYYLIAPFYWLGKGSPVFVASVLSWLTVGAIFLIYWLAKEIYGRKIGLIAAFLYGFSYELVKFSRWLANPNPLPFFTLLAMIFLYKFIQTNNSKFLILGSFIIGLCLQLEAASAIFFIPATILILIIQGRKLLKPHLLFFAFLAFFITLTPQIIFNFRHQGILLAAFKKFLITERSFQLSFLETFLKRFFLYYDVFLGKLFPASPIFRTIALILFLISLVVFKKKIFNLGGKLLGIWLVTPLVGFLFYKGNYGYVWDYYFTGIIPTFLILFAAGAFFLWVRKPFLRPLFLIMLFLFLFDNFKLLKNYLKTGIGITLQAQIKAIDWIYNDAKRGNFNVDIYVPPQIYYSYSYLFKWYGRQKYGREPETKIVQNLYTLYEPDNEHPQFLKAWLERQNTIGKILKEYNWGDITVQKRERIKYE